MRIDRKKIVNKCGYDQVECMLLAKRLSECPDDALISELKKITVWNYGKCELGLWADVLDRLDLILEYAVTKVGKWMLRLDLPENTSLVQDVVTILEFTGHLIEHSIYRYLYGSWNHILALFGSENMDILLAVLGLSYNFSKRSNYFVRLDAHNKKMILDRLVSIAETWGGTENNFGLAACCDPNHFPETAGNVYFEYISGSDDCSDETSSDPQKSEFTESHSAGGCTAPCVRRNTALWSKNEKIVLHALHRRLQSPSQIMEEILSQHPVPPSRQMALFARIRLATYFSNPEQRHKCIRARLQALSILSYTFEVDERNLYPSLLDELVEVLELPDGQFMRIKACALRTMTAIVNSLRLGVNWASLVGSTGLSNYHGTLPNLTRRWVQGLVDGTIDAPGGSTNQHFTTALLSFLYHLACYEENIGPGTTSTPTLNASGVLDTMLQLIAWHTSRNDCLSYVTRAVRVTDQILMSVTVSRQNVANILVDRLRYEIDLVLNTPVDIKSFSDASPILNTQRSGLMKSILNLLKRLSLDTGWSEVMHSAMDSTLPDILRRIFLNGSTHFTPHLALFAMECITNYLYTYPSRISAMQDRGITTDILTALTSQPLPQNRDFLVQLPGLFNTLALNARGIEAIQQSGVLTKYLETLISPDYLPTMKTKRVRDFLSQISYNLTSATGQNLSNSLTANQMSIAVQQLLRSHTELKSVVFQNLVACLRHVVEVGNMQPATLIVEPVFCVGNSHSISSDPKPCSSFQESSFGPHDHMTEDISSLTDITAGSQNAVNSTEHSTVNIPVSMLDDVIMLSGGEDDENDIDDLSRGTQTRPMTAQSSRHILDSRSTSPTPSLAYKDNASQSAASRSLSVLQDGSPAPAHLFLPDFILNTCKFLEKLLPSVMHVTEAMCRHFLSYGGLQVLCDLLRMPGLPYDFPVSAACASLCKVFEDLANCAYLNDVMEPLFQCLDSSLEKLIELQHSDFSMSSMLLSEYMAHEHALLHELVVVASIICILVQVIDHLKPDFRSSLANKWIGRCVLRPLGRLYLSVSWEAAILIRMLFGDSTITEADITAPTKWSTASSTSKSSKGSAKLGDESSVITSASWLPVTDNNTVPQFVEALHIYALLKSLKLHQNDNQSAFLRQRPELTKATQRILHVTAFFINSFTELCTAWGRFFSNRNPSTYRRRRTTLLPSEQIASATKYAALSEISQVLSSVLSWEPSLPVIHQHPAAPPLVYAMRYAGVRLVNALLQDSCNKAAQNGIMNTFFVLQGIPRFFGLFRELLSFDLTDPTVREPLAEVLEEWLVCADRISTSEHNKDSSRSTDVDTPAIEPEKYLECVYQNMLLPLEHLCTRQDLQNLLTRRAVEHLISMLVTIVPYLFNTDSKMNIVAQSKDSTASIESENAPLTVNLPVTTGFNVVDHSAVPSSRIDDSESVSQTVFQPIAGPTELANSIPTSTIPPTVLSSSSVVQPMDTSDSISSDAPSEMNATLQLMEEMGFSRELATIALEQTNWNTNEAVNLLITTSEHELLANASSMVHTTRRALTGTGSARRRDTNELSEDNSVVRSASAIAAAAMQLASAASSFISSTESAISHVNATLSRITNMDRSRVSTQALPVLPTPMVTQSVNDLKTVEPLAPDMINQLRDSLKQHVFRACYTIAKRHNSDQILHRIAQLLLSSGEEERYIDELFGFVACNLSERIGLPVSSTSSVVTQSRSLASETSVKEHPIVGLHLIALLFTRCQSLCARLAHTHKLPDLLIAWTARSDVIGMHTSVSDDKDTASAHTESTTEYYKTLMLACLILDQYERSIKAMHLRRLSTKFYTSSHSWHWFDDRAMIWHPYATESDQLIDKAFHNGELYAYCHISRRPYAIEFPTLSQVNMNSLHRRPVMIFPSYSEDTESISGSSYEHAILNDEIPSSLQSEQCRVLINALLDRMEDVNHSSPRSVPPIPSDCANAILRLLLRLVFSSYTNAQEMSNRDFLSILFKFPHTREFSSEYSTFVGALLIQVFDDVPTVTRVMRDILVKMCRFGVPSSFMGVGTTSSACRDLFYLLGMCAPLFAKDYDKARELACENMSLSLSDADVLAKSIPKNFTVESPTKSSTHSESDFVLSDRQKTLFIQLIEIIMRPSISDSTVCNTKAARKLTSSSAQDGHTGLIGATPSSSHATVSSHNESQSEESDKNAAPQLGNTSNHVNYVVLGRADAIRYLIDLLASHKPAAEFIAHYRPKHEVRSYETDGSHTSSFLAHLFDCQLNDPDTTDLTACLLESLILIACDTTQDTIIAEYKASLWRISVMTAKQQSTASNDVAHIVRNDRLSAHMLFLKRLLLLPPPLVDRLVRLIYRRHIPADVAKLIALVDCNLVNTMSTWMVILHTLENLTWVDRQMSKLVNATHDRRTEDVRSSRVEQNNARITHTDDVHSTANVTSHHTESNESVPDPANRRQFPTDSGIAERDSISGMRVYDSDSDDDDDDHHDTGMVESSTYHISNSPTSAVDSTTTPASSAALNLVLDEVILSGADVVLDQSGTQSRNGQSWHPGATTEDDSVIFVHDDEDEGSAGQGGVEENSQDDDEEDDEDVVDDDDEDGEADDDEDEVDANNNDDEEEDDDGGGGETDEEVIAEDGGVALVLRSGSSGRRLRGSRRPHTEATISVSVTTGRSSSDHETTASAGESVRTGFQRSTNELDLHNDPQDDSDGIFDDAELDTFDRDGDDTDLDILNQGATVPIVLNSDGRVLRDSNPVVAMVEEVLSLVDAPQHMAPTIGSRNSGFRRDRFVLTPSEFTGLNIIPSGNSSVGNWGLFFPRPAISMNGEGHSRGAASMNTGFPPNTTVFRFGIGGSGSSTSVFVTGGNSSRLNASTASLLAPGSIVSGNASSQPVVPATLASQHPLLQIPPTLSNDTRQVTSIGGNTIYFSSSNTVRPSRAVVAHTSTTPLVSRLSSALPPVLPTTSSASSTTRGRGVGPVLGPALFGNSGLRGRGPPTRLYASFNTDPSGGPHVHSSDIDSLTSTTTGMSTGVSDTLRNHRDHRVSLEADTMVWSMLSYLAEEQPSSVNSALASALFSQLDSTEMSNRSSSTINMGTSSQLAPYAGYALPASYRRWINMSRMLFGHELMDLTLIGRYQIYNELASKRRARLNERILASEQSNDAQPTVAPQDVSAVTDSTVVVESTQLHAPHEDLNANQLAPFANMQSPITEPPHVATDTLSSVSIVGNDNRTHTVEIATGSSDLIQPTGSLADIQARDTSTNPSTSVTEPVETCGPPTLDSSVQPTTSANDTIAAPIVPVTDEETIQSLIESGMDPSFLDALPEDVQREVIANHRHARRVQQQLSSITLPEHIDSDWLAGLPPHIQEEVLIQFRNEQQQQQRRHEAAITDGTDSGREADSHLSEPQPESNTAFLAGLSASLRREVLADIDESQLDMLPPDLAAEARQLRRRLEERFAQAVQGGMLTHSYTSRHEPERWRNLTSATGLIGGPGRWDVRFSSINQLLRHLNNSVAGGPLGPSTLSLGLPNSSGIRGRHLVDHEGLMCLLVLLIACSPNSQQRRHIMPTLKKVIRNVSCHFATRTWIVGTLLSLFNGLSERFSQKTSHTMIDSVTSTSQLQCDLHSEPMKTSISLPNDTIFSLGFEAALGCWVRIFHPINSDARHTQRDTAPKTPTLRLVEDASATLEAHHHIIHPQAAVPVSTVLLDTLDTLAKAFPVHFYPRSLGESKSETSGLSVEWPRPAFWDLFDRLAESLPSIGSTNSQSRATRRSHMANRRRQSSTSMKHTADPSQRLAVTQEISSQTVVSTPMDVCEVGTSTKSELTNSNISCRHRSTTTTSNTDYFVQLANLLCHPLVRDRSTHQERILSILAGVVKEFILSRAQSTESHRRSTQATESNQTETTSTTLTNTNRNAPSMDDPPTEPETGVSTTSSLSHNLIGPLRVEVLSALCQYVSDSKSTEPGRELAAQLITDLARANEKNKELMLQLLRDLAAQLAKTLSVQLQKICDEIDMHEKSFTVPNVPYSTEPSSSTQPASLDLLPDRFNDSGQMVVISGEHHVSSPSIAFSNLQLKSAQNFSCQNSCQSRFRGIISIIIRIGAGECSTNITEAVSVSGEDPLESVTIFKEFWPMLSMVFNKLQSTGDSNAVLLLQPLLEAFCLAHLHLVKDFILIRQRSVANRSSRSNLTTTTAGSHRFVDIVPTLQLRVEFPQPSERSGSTHLPDVSDHTTHVHLDVMGPTSPTTHTAEPEPTFDTVHCASDSTVSNPMSNAILEFAERHRWGLNQILRQSGNALGESPFAVFLVYPRVLDFDIKRHFFRQQLQSLSPPLSNRYDDEPIVISRDRIFEDSYARLHRKSAAEWKHKFVIRFQNEEGQDAGGPLREWFLLMSREIFNPNYCLFRTSPSDRVTYTINPSSYINSNHLSYFKFVGRFIAKAIYDNKLLECYFSRSFYKHILGVPVKCSDMESEDYEFYKGLEFLLTHHVSDLGYELTFSTEINEFGKTETRDLLENGRNIHVCEQTKREYVRLVCQEKMTGAIRQQLDAFLTGFYEIVPKRMIGIFNEQELELLISGLPNIDVADLKANTTYSKYQPTSPQIEWFWRALESFDQEDRARFLQFVTGTSKVPLGGFANLEGMHGPTKFQISQASASTTSHLPCAHTCFNTLVLPAYESYEQLRHRLLTAIRECSEGYGMA